MESHNLDEAVLDHLHTIAFTKRALLQTAVEIAEDFPAQGALLLNIINSLTRSADKLLGETQTTETPL